MTRRNDTKINPNPSGYCLCGCGLKTAIAQKSESRSNHVKGFPKPYVGKHALRKFGYHINEITGCWLWEFNIDKDGYPTMFREGKNKMVHRVIYEETFGAIPQDKPVLHHKCEHRRCVNPDHMEPTTRSEHIKMHHAQDAVGRSKTAKNYHNT